jgi:hypothetical protein
MPYTVEYQEKEGYLLAIVRGERTLEEVVNMAAEIYSAVIERHQRRLLLDVREFTGRLQNVESYEVVVDEFPKYRNVGLERVAVLDHGSPGEQQWSFFETVAKNRGYILNIYTDPSSAITWLREGFEDRKEEEKGTSRKE